jgi:hypothetical protein
VLAWSTDFAGHEDKWDVIEGSGRISFGVSDAHAIDHVVAALAFPGDQSLGATDRVGPRFGTEIDTRDRFLFGTFRTRVRFATCAANEEVVNGIFTYRNNGADDNGNGLPDNSEIDIEVLCGAPSIILMSTWTDYQEAPERFLKWSRSVDLATGAYAESPSDHEYGLVPLGTRAEFVHPGFPDPEAFYEIGFDWQPARLRFFIVLGGSEITLWDFREAKYIPQRASPWLFNVWHPREHWFGAGGAADYPAGDATMLIDWARYYAS